MFSFRNLAGEDGGADAGEDGGADKENMTPSHIPPPSSLVND